MHNYATVTVCNSVASLLATNNVAASGLGLHVVVRNCAIYLQHYSNNTADYVHANVMHFSNMRALVKALRVLLSTNVITASIDTLYICERALHSSVLNNYIDNNKIEGEVF